MGQPKVSVIIPVYNTEKYLRKCLDSVVNQTLKSIEVICVDDGSTDGSLSILREYGEKDPRVHVFTQQNINAGAARNHGLKFATGEYLAFLDSDDFYDTRMLEKTIKCAEERNAEIVICRTKRLIEESGMTVDYAVPIRKKLLPSELVFSFQDIEKDAFCCILGYDWDKLIKRDLVERNHLQFQSQAVFNDAYFAYTALLSAHSITVLEEPLIFYRKRRTQESITDKRFLYNDCSYSFLRGLKDFMLQKNLYSRFERDFINYVIHLFLVDLNTKNRKVTDEMRSNIRAWLEEFHVNEHYAEYYYNLSSYQSLLEQILVGQSSEKSDRKIETDQAKVEIPIIYATDANYMKYVLTSMVSALQYAKSNTFYNFYILIPESEEEKCKSINLEDRLSKFDNFTLTYISVDDRFNNAKLYISHITTPTYYRLSAPSLLPDIDKCIYLDADTIVCDDLQSFFSIDLQDNYFAGVPAYIYYENSEYHKKRLQLDKDVSFKYVNAGVLLMNLARMRTKEDLFLQMIDQEFESQDQDILNVACFGKIKMLPFKYNVMTKYVAWNLAHYSTWAYPVDIVEGLNFPVVVHYADKIKPWNEFSSPYSNLWYSSAMTDMCWDIFVEDTAIKVKKNRLDSRFLFLLRETRRYYAAHGFTYTVSRILEYVWMRR